MDSYSINATESVEGSQSSSLGNSSWGRATSIYTAQSSRVGLLQVAARSVPGSEHPYEDRILVDEDLGLFAVADGVTNSSQGSGGAAADLALKLLRENFAGDIKTAIDAVHLGALRRRGKDRTIGETTLTAVAVHGRSLQASNVGDSPAYLVRGGKMQALFQEDRSPYGYITQVIGYPATIQVHSSKVQLEDRDLALVASDGIGHILHPSTLHELIGRTDVGEVADAMIEEARARRIGYDDDKSVIVLRFRDE
jgi:serine/threonine protein phosphatase PrpC